MMATRFKDAGLPFADEDALDLLLDATGLSQTDYVLKGNDPVPATQIDALSAVTTRRLSGEPVDRILGWREFYGRRFFIDNVLSPRGDTEVLLLAALDAIQQVRSPRILDLGTGSGALAISLLCERPDATVVATDLSLSALETAQRNAKALSVSEALELRQSDWFENISETDFHAILSNPPYITSDSMAGLDPEVANHDPELALHGGQDGLIPYRVLVPEARDHLRPGGWLGVEIGYDQGRAVMTLFESNSYSDICCLKDPSGHDRVVSGQIE